MVLTGFNNITSMQVHGFVQDAAGGKVATLFGKWDDSMHYIIGDGGARQRDSNTVTNAELLWKRNKPPPNLTRYNLTSFAITLNELTAGLQVDIVYLIEFLSSSFVFISYSNLLIQCDPLLLFFPCEGEAPTHRFKT